MRRVSRRQLLRLAPAAGLALAGCDSSRPRDGVLGSLARFNERVQQLVFDPDRLAPELPESDATPIASYPKYFQSPSIPSAPTGWHLKVGGLVKTPLTLTPDALQRLARTDLRVRHHCVEGWSAVAAWHGVRVSELARAAGADPRARFVEFRSFDADYWSCWDAASALHPQTIVAYGMNGAPLPPGHGAPARLYGAVKLGYKMVKYLTEVNFLDANTGGYWEDQGYDWWAGV